MRVLIIGSGGREHALAWKISSSALLTQLFCAPGNPGTAQYAVNLSVDYRDFATLKSAVLENRIEMVIVGPEDPLVNGLRDRFENDEELSDIIFIGPGSLGAKLEGSKEFAKNFMERWDIPTARYKSFSIEAIDIAYEFLESLNAPYVLKADGLAGGKGVVIASDLNEAKEELRSMLSGKFGDAGNRVVIEEYLSGIELSMFILTDGKEYLLLPEAKDYKRILDGDKGLNTGGMGAVSPVPFADKEFVAKVEERIIKRTLCGLQGDNIDYKGFIFIGLMNCGGDPYVIEYNVRMGDPETEVVMPRIESDFLSHLVALGNGRLGFEKILISDNYGVTVVMVSGGYPQKFEKGFEISGIDSMQEGVLFHSGTSYREEKIVTNGGRVLAYTVLGSDIITIRNRIYADIEKLEYEGKYFRRDIGLDLIR